MQIYVPHNHKHTHTHTYWSIVGLIDKGGSQITITQHK